MSPDTAPAEPRPTSRAERLAGAGAMQPLARRAAACGPEDDDRATRRAPLADIHIDLPVDGESDDADALVELPMDGDADAGDTIRMPL